MTDDENISNETDASVAEEVELVTEDQMVPDFKYEIAKQPGGENFLRCIQCGTCTASCPVKDQEDRFNCRRIIRASVLGLKEEVLTSDLIWMCSTCYNCYQRCPNDVKITNIITALRNLAVKEGHIHPGYLGQLKLMASQGRLLEISEFEVKMREKTGLPQLVQSGEDIKKIFERLGLDKVLDEEGGGQ